LGKFKKDGGELFLEVAGEESLETDWERLSELLEESSFLSGAVCRLILI